jgi:undecaprenyl-diphosphatase
MSYIEAVILGIVQGLTEFLPVSSSGHLVLAQHVLGVKQPGVSFELLMHVGTLAAVLVCFRSRILSLVRSLYTPSMRDERVMILLLVIGTIPAGLFGILFGDFFKAAFARPAVAAGMLLVTGAILLSTRFVRKGENPVRWLSATVMGLGQAVAIMPGISRSGSTIAAGMFSGVQPSKAAEFSFLMSIPVIAGATLLDARDLAALDTTQIGPYLTGTAVAFVFGLGAIEGLLSIIRKGRFEYFAYYCFAVGAVGLYLLL